MADETARTLLVVGAARGAGRWLVEHVLPSATWSRVILADVHWPARERDLARLSALYSAPLNLAVSQPHGALSDLATGRELPVPGPASARTSRRRGAPERRATFRRA